MAHKRYKVGVIGTAWAARSPLPTFASYPPVELYAICSARLERAREAAERFGAPLFFDDYRTMVQLPELDIVYIAAPVYLHHPMTLAAAAAGKHVLCEKPAAVNVREAQEMLAACQQAGVAHAMAFTMRYFPHTLYIQRLVAEGFLGDLRHAAIQQWAGFPAGGPLRPWSWLNDASLGGGYLGAMGSHYIDLLRAWFGEWESVTGLLRTWQTEYLANDGSIKTATAEDAFAILGTLANGALVTIQWLFGCRAASGQRIELYGSHGSIVVDQDLQVHLAGPQDRALQPVTVPEPDFSESVARAAAPRFAQIVAHLIEAIESGEPRHPNLEDGLRCQEVMDAVRRASAAGLPKIREAAPA
ncbi:MAG: Gfo/Idh/MocA family oxidoreductase [Chloroflexi bacterium]|nr:Gfo/Idh/MocA family oxidoreductase [Chloroflexota bacterium]